jgi:hypothetical protein
MIEEFYASHIKNTVDASVINVRQLQAAQSVTAPEREMTKSSPIRWKCNAVEQVRGRGETGRRQRLEQLECPRGNPRCRTAKLGETGHRQLEPSAPAERLVPAVSTLPLGVAWREKGEERDMLPGLKAGASAPAYRQQSRLKDKP